MDGNPHMRNAGKVGLVLVATVLGMVVGFAAIFALVAMTESCPAGIHTCDVGPIAGVGLGLVASPITGLLAGWQAVRYLNRRKRTSDAPTI
jgi:hypothetical protein